MTFRLLPGILVGLSCAALAQPPASLTAKQPLKMMFRVEPKGACIYAKAVAAGEAPSKDGDLSNNIVYLGKTGELLQIDQEKFREGKLTYHVGGEKPQDGPVPQFHGYQILTDFVPSGALDFKEPDGILYHPLRSESPRKLQPAPGIGPFFQRTLYWFQTHPLISLGLLVVSGAGAFFLIAVVLPRHKSWLEEQAKVRKFNERLRSLDVQNDLFLGRQFGEWATVKRLGAGGMAVVYKGVSTLTMNEDEAVAVKVMSPDLAQDVEYRRRFDREVQISRTLSHANVVRMIDHGDQDGVLYLVMEYIQGTTLRELLPEKGFPLPEGMPLALGIVNGLIHAHQKGVVHRDLKPDNVMVTDNRLVKVMDLGLAKREESENVTRTGDTFGTPAYMAPEQITGGSLLPATDQYAFGVMLFEMFTGRRPFDVADSLTLVMKHLQEPPPRVREYKSQLPEELDALIDRMLLKDPAKRYKNLVEVQVELQKIQRKYCPT